MSHDSAGFARQNQAKKQEVRGTPEQMANFKEIAKRFYSRIDPQNPLPALIIRTKNLKIF